MVAVTDFRTVAELARLVGHNLWRLPGGFSVVAAIPESGRLPAALIGLQTGRPVCDLDALLAPGAPAPEGAVLLVDERFDERRYRSLFPVAWRPSVVRSSEELREELDRFWSAR